MDLNTALAELGEMELLEELRPYWDQAMADLRELPPAFLTPAQVKVNREWCGFDPATGPIFEAAAEKIARSEALSRMTWLIYWLVFERAERPLPKLPQFKQALGEDGIFLHLLAAMAIVPLIREFHRGIGVAEDVTRACCNRVRCFSSNYERAHNGHPGIFPNQLSWLRHYASGSLLFRLGRLEYWAAPFHGWITAFRNRRTGEVLALANAGLHLNSNGLGFDPAKVSQYGEGWTSTLEITATAARGYPINPAGFAVRREISLPLNVWKLVLGPGDLVLDIHIPEGGDMAPEKCRDSLRRALEFFHHHFPYPRPVAFTCLSWIFGPQLETLLPPASNLVRFMREAYLFPVPSAETNVWFVFLQDQFDPATAPRDTSLRRAIYDHLAAGNLFHNGGMFLLADDLKYFGHQHYRKTSTLVSAAGS